MKNVLTFLFVLGTMVSMAQDSDPMVTDRPTQSAASMVVPKGNAIIEYGFIHESAGDLNNLTFANLHARIGLFQGVEFRVTQNIQQTKNTVTDVKVSGLSPLTLGTKIHVIGEQGAVPQTSVIAQVTLDNGDDAFRPGEAIPEVRFNFSNTLSEFLSLGYNIGFAFPEDNTTTIYTAVLGYSFQPGWTVFAEPYGFIYDGGSDHRFNAGFIYLVKNNFQVDLTGGIGLSDISPDSFFGFGAAIGF
ncbi:transporter [Ekhidna sp.]|uniref:transporter n=1 Tax=Ekhidna sp. TaxID=2608089 RepID=UPI003B50C7C4